jgi:hypothetical protein
LSCSSSHFHWVVQRGVGATARAGLQVAAEIAHIEHDHLNALALWAIHLGFVDAFLFAAWRILGYLEEVEKRLLGLLFQRVVGPGVVLAEVVVVPGAQQRA